MANVIEVKEGKKIYNGTSGADSIVAVDNSFTQENNTYINQYMGATVNADAGDDTISGKGYYDSSKINGGAGNDYIYINGWSNTINGGIGDDTIYGSSSDVIEYASGDGNDIIYGSSYRNIHLTSGNIDNISLNASNWKNADVTVKVGTGSITLKNVYDSVIHIEKPDGSSKSIIYDGSQLVDVIYNADCLEEVPGTDGDDYIYNSGSESTITGGKGNDTIKLNDAFSFINYAAGDGKDTIYGLSVYDTINVTSGSISGISAVNNNKYYWDYSNAIINVGSGSIYLYNQGYKPINIRDSSGNVNTIVFDGRNTVRASVAKYNTDVNNFDGTSENDFIYVYYASPKVNAGFGDDTIYGSFDHLSINGGDGDDSIRSTSYYGAQYNTIVGGKGNDTIQLGYGSYNLIQYAEGDGKDVISNLRDSDTIQITNGTVSNIEGSESDVVLTVGSGSITLKWSEYKMINLQNADGSLKKIFYDGKQIREDFIYNSTSNVEVNGTSGNDYIYNSGGKATVSSGSGNDTIRNNGYTSVINAGEGNNLIEEAGGGTSIKSASGNDVINIEYGWMDTINAGRGNDTINFDGSDGGNIIQYAVGDGNDVINVDYGFYDTIELSAGTNIDNYSINDDTHVLTIGEGSISLSGIEASGYGFNRDALVKVRSAKSGGGFNYTRYVNGITFNDVSGSLEASTDNGNYEYNGKVVKGSNGNDYIGFDYYYGESTNTTINAGAGNDYLVFRWNKNLELNGESGDDTIKGTYIGKSTVNGGEGNDIIQVSGDNGKYLIGYDDEDCGIYSSTGVADVFIKGGDGNDLIEYEATSDKYVHTYKPAGSSQDTSTWEEEKGRQVTIAGGKGNDTIRNAFIDRQSSFNETNDDGEGYSSTLKGYLESASTYVSTYVWKDTTEGTSGSTTHTMTMIYDRVIQYSEGDGDDVIEDYHSTDTLKIAGEYSTLTSDDSTDVTVKVGDGSILLKNAKDKTLHIVTFDGSGGDDTGGEDDPVDPTPPNPSNLDRVTLTDRDTSPYTATSQVGTIDGSSRTKAIKITANDYSNVITGGSGKNDIDGKAGNDTITGGKSADVLVSGDGWDVLNGGAGNDKLSGDAGNDTLKGEAGNDTLTGGEGRDLLDGGAGNDKLDGGAGIDTLLGDAGNDTINGGADDDILDGGAGNDRLFGEAGNDSLHGGDGSDKLDGGDGIDTILGGKGNDTLTGGSGADLFFYADGDGKDVITDYAASEDIIKLTSGTISKVTTSKSDVTFTIGKGSIKVSGGKGKAINFVDGNDNTIINQSFGDKTLKVTDSSSDSINAAIDSVVVTIDSSERTKAVELIGNTKANVIQLGSGEATVTGGKGKDTIIYGGGNDLITDYTTKQDKLKFNVDIDDAVESGSDVVFTLGTGKVTVVGGKGNKINIIDKNGKEQSVIIASEVKLTNSDFADFKALSSVVSIDASKRTKAINIVGNAANNSITGGKAKDTLSGGDGADTLTGGKGNDTLTGGTGADVFYYTSGDGSDVITDYSASDGDLIRLGKSTIIKKVAFSGNDLILSIGSGKITIKDGANQTVTVVDGNDLKATYEKFSKTVGFTERWFLESDDNFTTSDVSTLLNTDSNINADYSLKSELKLNQIADTISLTSNLAKNK